MPARPRLPDLGLAGAGAPAATRAATVSAPLPLARGAAGSPGAGTLAVAARDRVATASRDGHSVIGIGGERRPAKDASGDGRLAREPSILAPHGAEPAALPADVLGAPFRIQLGAFRTRAEAQRQRARLLDAYGGLLPDLRLVVQESWVGAVLYYRVRGGPFMAADHAEAACGVFLARDVDCMVWARPG